MQVLPAVFWSQKLSIWMRVHWFLCHINTFMCQNAAAIHVSLNMLLVILPKKNLTIFSMPGNKKKISHKTCHSVKQVLLVKLQRGINQGKDTCINSDMAVCKIVMHNIVKLTVIWGEALPTQRNSTETHTPKLLPSLTPTRHSSKHFNNF